MTEWDFHLPKGWEVQQFSRTARINKDSVHIKVVNTQGEYKRIIMGSDNPSRVYMRKGYGAIDRLNRCATLLGTDGVYSGSD